jgi:nucleoside-diphosphate-sugar epimerase
MSIGIAQNKKVHEFFLFFLFNAKNEKKESLLMNILIIGAGGFIGSHLSEELLKRHTAWEITAIDISNAKISHLLCNPNFHFLKLDILKDSLEDYIEASNVVFPLAAIASPSIYVRDPLRVFELDFEANLKIVKLAVKHKTRIIFPSTSEVYGMSQDAEFEEDYSNCVTGPICKQRWIYSCSKQMLDRVIYAYGIRDNLNYTLFRPFNWIGPRLDDICNKNNGSSRVVTQFLSNILHGDDIKVVGGGDQIRCFTYISDGIDALIKIIENDASSKRIINIGNPNNKCSIKELAEKMLALAKEYEKTKFNAERIKIVEIDSNDYYGKSYQDILVRVPSIQKAKGILDWHPKVGMEESLKKIMDFYFI